jgi:hypothetical protein
MSALPVPVRRRDLQAIGRRAMRTARVQALDTRQRRIRLWLPLTPLFLILAPFALLLSPLGYLAPGRYRPNPMLAVAMLGLLLLSMSGTEVLVDSPRAQVRIVIL